jgi:type II secretory ATPase GspE/PulE/Tfp pilus assembly ATPase PilB-like protein
MALFEVLEVTDPLRKAILQNPNADAARKAAASLGHRGFQQEGILSVVLGLTSLQEVQRVLQPPAK